MDISQCLNLGNSYFYLQKVPFMLAWFTPATLFSLSDVLKRSRLSTIGKRNGVTFSKSMLVYLDLNLLLLGSFAPRHCSIGRHLSFCSL